MQVTIKFQNSNLSNSFYDITLLTERIRVVTVICKIVYLVAVYARLYATQSKLTVS